MASAEHRRAPALFTLAPGPNRIDALVRALINDDLLGIDAGRDPLALADLTVFVPSQRLRKPIEQAFAAALAPRPLLLPQVRALAEPGDPADPDALLAGGDVTEAGEVSPLSRLMALLPRVEAWQAGFAEPVAGGGLAQAVAFAEALGRLLDEVRIEGFEPAHLARMPFQRFDPVSADEYWSRTEAFLRIVAEDWPAELAASGRRDRMEARLARIAAEARRIADPSTPGSFLVVGSTGSVRATAELMRAVAHHPRGAVVLPGLDLDADAEIRRALAEPDADLPTRFAHPQAALHRTLAALGGNLDSVRPIDTPPSVSVARFGLLREALRPAGTVAAWQATRAEPGLDAALDGLVLIEAEGEREEALAVALAIRERLDDPSTEVALVTPDRSLARRVTAELGRWGVAVEDSAGQPLDRAPAGRLVRALLDAAAAGSGAAVAVLLHDPALRLGWPEETARKAATAFEIAFLRGRRLAAGRSLAALAATAEVDRRHPAMAALAPDALAAVPVLAAALDAVLAPFRPEAPRATVAAFGAALRQALVAFRSDDEGHEALTGDPSTAELAGVLDELETERDGRLLSSTEFAALLGPLLRRRNVPPVRQDERPRVAIYGLLEARLIAADRVVVAGLNEGTFPSVSAGDPFLNRAMRLDLGLQPPEGRIGQAAHDLTLLFGHPDLVLSRAKRVDDQPSRPSRFLERLAAFLGKDRWQALVAAGAPFLAAAAAIDRPDVYRPEAPPAPRPAAPRLPDRLSVTEIEPLLRDPFAIYARRILELAPLDPFDPPPDTRELGTLYHAVLEALAKAPFEPDEAAARIAFLDTAAAILRPLAAEPEAHRFALAQIRRWFAPLRRMEQERIAAGRVLRVEETAEHRLVLPGGHRLKLRGRADRVELEPDGGAWLIDWKAGSAATTKDIERGDSPQLPVLAQLARLGAFAGLPAITAIRSCAYWSIGGTKGLERKGEISGEEADALAGRIWSDVLGRLAGFESGERPYASRLRPKASRHAGDFDGLARVAEWSDTGLSGDDEHEDGE